MDVCVRMYILIRVSFLIYQAKTDWKGGKKRYNKITKMTKYVTLPN